MKTPKLIALTAFALIFSQCKTTAPTAASGTVPSLVEVAQVLDTTQSIFFESALETNGDPYKAIELTASRLASYPLVKTAESIDSSHIDIELKSGLRTTFFYRQIDSNGRSLFRGGAPTPGANVVLLGTRSTNKIPNNNVLIYAGAYKEFYAPGEMEHITEMLSQSSAKLNVTLLKDEQCGYQMVEHFKDYGLVILDTHGDQDVFRSGTTLTVFDAQKGDDAFREVVKTQIGPDGYAKLLSGELVFGFDARVLQIPEWWKQTPGHVNLLHLFISTKYVDELPPMPNTVLFANTCYSGYQNPTRHGGTPYKTSFVNKNLLSYYGYAYISGSSNYVSDVFAKAMEDSLLRALTIDLDSTGIINLNSEQQEWYDDYLAKQSNGRSLLYLKHFGADNYSYDGCVDHFTDDRDQQVYQAVCIGKQTWMAENLRYNAPGSACYDDDPNNCITYGKLYDWNTVMNGAASSSSNPSRVQGICPKGWHVPSASEWTQLIDQLGGQAAAGYPLKATTLWTKADGSTNSSGFTAFPGGRRDLYNGAKEYIGIGEQAAFWTSTEYSQLPTGAYDILLLTGFSSVNVSGGVQKTDYNSCRCVKDP